MNLNFIIMIKSGLDSSATNVVRKIYKEVRLEAKNAPTGSYAAGCPSNYGSPDSCYICDYGG